jgi:cold shock CspA family protein
MRYQGRIVEWQDARGFGFILLNGGGSKVFLHIAAFTHRTRRPGIGDLVTYEVVTDDRGRVKATAVQFVTDRAPRHGKPSVILPTLFFLLVASLVGYVASVRLSHPNSTVAASVYRILVAREALHPNPAFQCDVEKSSCSLMTSCAEALFQQESCGVIGMDGDRDGIPCEQQWCN